jgi:hypothetical protein
MTFISLFGGIALFVAFTGCLNAPAGLASAVARDAASFIALSSQNTLRHFLKSQYADQTFNGLYHWNWFDLALLIPYFFVMIVLSIYGLHRYTMCYQYFKNKKNYNPNPVNYFDELPTVTIQLPMFNEQFVVERLIEAVCAMEYPREMLEIQVLDDSRLRHGVPAREARDPGPR